MTSYKINTDRLKETRLKPCPCVLIGEEPLDDVSCPCMDFIEIGKCRCGVFQKVEE